MEEINEWLDNEWNKNPPQNDGDFYYYGPLPGGGDNIVIIVQITTHPGTGQRLGCFFMPPGWRGNKMIVTPTLHAAELHMWTGEWSGPEFGLCCVDSE